MSNYNNITFCLNHSGELEADSIGLKLVASTGCDPRVALAIYKKTDFEGLLWGLIVCGPGPFIHWGLKARAEKCYSPGSVIQVQNGLGTQPRTIQSSACPRSHRKEGKKMVYKTAWEKI